MGLLLGKAAEASERAVVLEISPETWLSERPDKVQVLTTIVGNLVDNAFDALTGVAAPRSVVVEIVEDVDVITVVVTDNGPGIPPELVPTIFLDRYTTKARPGTRQRGLGLALVHRAVARLHGSVDVTAGSDGTGARFCVIIPTGEPDPPVATATTWAAQ